MENTVKGIGVDIISISLIEKIVKNYFNEMDYLYTKSEMKFCWQQDKYLVCFGICFSGKEAVAKALGTGFIGMQWNEIEIFPMRHSFKVYLYGNALSQGKAMNIFDWECCWFLSDSSICTTVVAK
jgi:holo-[acyl-carrier protein] synthase